MNYVEYLGWTAVQNEEADSYHKVRGIYFQVVVFVAGYFVVLIHLYSYTFM